jgi:hypothetical protein
VKNIKLRTKYTLVCFKQRKPLTVITLGDFNVVERKRNSVEIKKGIFIVDCMVGEIG